MNDDDDRTLLDAWKAGDAKAGNELLERHFDALYLFFRTKLDGPIDDLIQSTLLGCVEARDRYRGDAPFRVFLLGIARKRLLKHFRSSYRKAAVFAPDQLSIRDVVPDPQTGASLRLARGRDRALLLAAMRNLPIDLQIALELYYWEGMSLAEIAQVQDVPPGTVKSRLARGRDKLKQIMDELAGSPEAAEETLRNFEQWADELRESSD